MKRTNWKTGIQSIVYDFCANVSDNLKVLILHGGKTCISAVGGDTLCEYVTASRQDAGIDCGLN